MFKKWSVYKSVLFILIAMSMSGNAFAIDVQSKQALLIDVNSGKILFEKDADRALPPSSMSKIMTAYVVYKEIKAGRLFFDDEFLISRKAWKKGGSRMFLNVNSKAKVSELLRGLIVQSGNDAAIALAEGLAGTEEAFVELMNQEAKELGLERSHFVNATGWPDEGHVMSAKDLAVVALKTIENFPMYYSLYGEKEYTYNKIRQTNRNPLLYVDIGCDGLKTGHTEVGGYSLVASALQNGRRLILVLNGAKTKKQRAADSQALMNWGFTYWVSPKLYNEYDVVETADVWLGEKKQVPLVIDDDVYLTIPRHEFKDLVVELVYQTPIPAPIKAGDVIGKLVVKAPSTGVAEYDLTAGSDVGEAGFFDRIREAIKYLLWGGHETGAIEKKPAEKQKKTEVF